MGFCISTQKEQYHELLSIRSERLFLLHGQTVKMAESDEEFMMEIKYDYHQMAINLVHLYSFLRMTFQSLAMVSLLKTSKEKSVHPKIRPTQMYSPRSSCIMSVQYTKGCAVHWGISSTPGDNMSTVGDIMNTLRGVQYTGAYHDKYGGRSMGKQLNLYGNSSVLNIPQCTHDIPQCTEHPHCTQ